MNFRGFCSRQQISGKKGYLFSEGYLFKGFYGISVILGLSFLFFFVSKVLKNMKKNSTFVLTQSSEIPWRRRRKRHLALSNLTF